ncbi:MAG: hypothetical protein MI974_15015 [Chitinophagales bacterium]|nr:hypothetical protein [Chitinophagales bacterium]
MGTFSKVFINIDNIEIVKKIIGKYYKIVNEEIDTDEQGWRFWENGSDTIILSKNYNKNWVEIVLNYEFTLYFHDELLRRLSKELQTKILLGYYQSTCGDGRLAKFQNGELLLSIIQSEVKYGEESMMRLMDNWGVTDKIKQEFSIPEKTREKFFEIGGDTIYQFFGMHGLKWDTKEGENEEYLHLEIRYE